MPDTVDRRNASGPVIHFSALREIHNSRTVSVHSEHNSAWSADTGLLTVAPTRVGQSVTVALVRKHYVQLKDQARTFDALAQFRERSYQLNVTCVVERFHTRQADVISAAMPYSGSLYGTSFSP